MLLIPVLAVMAAYLFIDSRTAAPLGPICPGSTGKCATFGDHHLRIITPEQFGARGNGKHNDTAALQRAIDAAAGRAIVLLPRGRVYLCRATLLLPSNTILEGSGTSSILKFTWFSASGARSGNGRYIGNMNFGDSNIFLSDFLIHGAGSGLPSGPSSLYPTGLASAVNLRNISHFSITHLEVEDTPGISIAYFGSQNGVIEYNHVHNSGRDGITGFWDSRNLSNITVAHNDIAEVGDDGIAINGLPIAHTPVNDSALPTDIHITNNIVVGWRDNPNGKALGRGIALNGVTNVIVKNNSIANTYSAGIFLIGCNNAFCPTSAGVIDPGTGTPWTSEGVQILDNKIANAGRLSLHSTLGVPEPPTSGIYISTSGNSIVSGNVITDSRGAAVDNNGCTNCSVQPR